MPLGAQLAVQHAATPPENRLYTWIILALLGIASGILTMTGPYLKGSGFYLSNGGLFGLALLTYFFLYTRHRSMLRAVVFVAMSIAAYFCATWGAIYSSKLFMSGRPETPLASLFVGGAIGGFLLLTAVLFIFRPRGVPDSHLLMKAVIGSLASGGLGVLGWALGPSLGRALWSVLPTAALPGPDTFNQFSLYFVWQSVMALLVGFINNPQQQESIAVTTRQLPPGWDQGGQQSALTKKMFFFVVTMLLAVVICRALPIRMSVAKREAGRARVRAEIPSMDNLSAIQPVAVDDALINAPIAGFNPHRAVQAPEMVSHEKDFLRPGDIYYAITYSPDIDSFRTNQNSVTVSVQQYPNTQWASYLAEFPHNIYNSFDNPKTHATVTRFQNKVRTNFSDRPAGTGLLYYMWPSGNNVVTVTYYTLDEKGDFLRLYLKKYPSSIP